MPQDALHIPHGALLAGMNLRLPASQARKELGGWRRDSVCVRMGLSVCHGRRLDCSLAATVCAQGTLSAARSAAETDAAHATYIFIRICTGFQ